MIRNTKKGFTLLELLVVISIIAILIGLSTVSFSTAQKKSRNAKRRADMKAVANAFEQYYATNSNVYAASCTSMTASLPQGLPKDPKNVAPNVYDFSSSCATTAFCVCALLENETGNANAPAGSACNFTSSGGTYYCVSSLQ